MDPVFDYSLHSHAVSLSNKYVEGKVYNAPVGWHWATAAEVAAVPGWEPKSGTRNYYNQARLGRL